MKKILMSLLVFLPIFANAQLTEGKYKVEYNAGTCRYDVFMIPLAGTATTTAQRTGRTCRISLVLPTGTTITSQVNNEPINTALNVPNDWTQTDNITTPVGLTGFYVQAFDLTVSNSVYSSITSSTTQVLLFSVKLSTTACGAGIRLWNNYEIQGVPVSGDPSSAVIGDLVSYNNSFKIGLGTIGNTDRYTGNVAGNVTPTGPTVSNITRSSAGNLLTISATTTASPCAPIVSYAWTTTGSATPVSVNTMPGKFSGTSAQQNGGYAIKVTDANGCSAQISTAIALPVTLTSFDASVIDCKTAITWVTSEEKNADRYEIERGTNGKEWTSIGAVKAKGVNGGNYSFTDKAPVAGNNQYRLKMIDQNGTASNSQVRTVKNDCAVKAEILVYPTSVSGDVYIALPKGNENAQIMLLNDLGQVVSTKAAGFGTQLQSFSMSALAAGQYMVRVVTETEAKTFKVIKH